MRKAYSYIRFSSKKQAAGDSLSRQKDLAKAYALANDLDLDTSLNFADLGVSGYTGEHVATGALGLFIKAVESGSTMVRSNEPDSSTFISHDRFENAACEYSVSSSVIRFMLYLGYIRIRSL